MIMIDSRIVGDIVVIKKEDKHYYLQCICVIPEFENKGIGSVAMSFIEKEFADALLWSLVTPADKLRNHTFYKKHGLIITKELQTQHIKMCFFEKAM